jgi:hypothetical protein
VKPVAAVHLVRKTNGLEPLRRFIDSYRRYDAGIEHDLVFILKGFERDAERASYRALLGSLGHRTVELPDSGYDITSYWLTGARLEHPHFCFLNSFSVILAAGWLGKLYRAAIRPGVGLAGATGSYQSFYPSSLASYMEVSRRVRHRGRIKDVLMTLPFAHHMNYVRRKFLHGPGFDPFPNYHVRTNAFLLRRDLMHRVRLPRVPLHSKMESYRFESGKRGLTVQVMQLGLAPVVVGADGTSFTKEDWHLSNCFWQSRQENLMVADNQTRQYSDGGAEMRSLLSYMAWGDLARPA